MNFDLLITGGKIIDGSGKPAFIGDVGVVGEKIEAIGDLSGATATKTIDGSGCYVSPGFIDVHSHSDAYLLIEPSAASKIFQGVTTEIVGNCGASAAPLMGDYKMPSDWIDKEYPAKWSTVSEYRALFDQISPAVNVALLVGHNTLHAGVCGYEPRGANPDELKKMESVLEQAFDEGACGFSTGLLYVPGSAAPTDELIFLGKIAGKRGKIYTTHMRSEGARLLESLDETIRICREAGVRTQISHLKTSGKANWHLIDDAIAKIHSAINDGLPIASDRYPYTAACTDLDVILPDWAGFGGRAAVLERLKNRETLEKIRAEIIESRSDSYWKTVMIGSTSSNYKGLMLVEAAEKMGVSPVDAALYLITADELKTGGIFFGMSEENMWRILAEPFVMVGSDASLRAPTGVLSDDHPHPRAYGTFTKLLRASLDGDFLPIEECVRKMTSLPASQFSLKNRGEIKHGFFADILVFSGDEIVEKTTYANPHQLSEGMRFVIVNGVATIANKKMTNSNAGRFLD